MEKENWTSLFIIIAKKDLGEKPTANNINFKQNGHSLDSFSVA